jgi:hypothetical protein
MSIGDASRSAEMNDSRSSHLRVPLVGAALLATAGLLTLPHLECPGLYYDETLFVEPWSGLRCAWCPNGMPIMALSYLGALKTWLYWPLRDVLTPDLIRGPWVLLGMASMLLAAMTAYRAFGARAGLFAGALLATDPAFLYFQRLDWGPVSIGVFLRSLSLLLLFRWRATSSVPPLFAAAFLLGLGIYDKLNFAWFVTGVLLGMLASREHWPRARWSTTAGAFMAFAVGSFPLLAYNATFPFASFRENALLAGGGSTLATIPERLRLIRASLDGTLLYQLVNGERLSDIFASGAALGPLVSLASILGISMMTDVRRNPDVQVLWWSTATTLIALLAVANVGPHHVPTLFPGIQILAAVSLAKSSERGGARRALLVSGAIGAVFLGNVLVDMRTIVSFASVCGKGRWSDAIYGAADFVRGHPGDRIFVADWGIACQLRALAPGVPIVELTWKLEEDPASAWDTMTSPGPGRRYVILHDESETIRSAARHALVRSVGNRARLDLVTTMTDRSAIPVIEIAELNDSHAMTPANGSTAANVP